MLPDDFMQKFDREGKPISEERWLELLADREYRFVLQTKAHDDAVVITIWDGYDPYRMRSEWPHLFFETTAFRPSADTSGARLALGDERHWKADRKFDSVRHGSEESARAYHLSVVERIRSEPSEGQRY
jgi:hypothetical protein